jgi:mRNA interferase MazF
MVKATSYTPNAGDVLWLDFDPHIGQEQGGHRPALVLSPAAYSRKTGLLICCPLTTHIKAYPFEVLLPGTPKSAVLADMIKSFDWRKRQAKLKGSVSANEFAEVKDKIRAFIG